MSNSLSYYKRNGIIRYNFLARCNVSDRFYPAVSLLYDLGKGFNVLNEEFTNGQYQTTSLARLCAPIIFMIKLVYGLDNSDRGNKDMQNWIHHLITLRDSTTPLQLDLRFD